MPEVLLLHHSMQHPIGQGFFYSGTIRLGEDPREILRYVYDCGSTSAKSALITETSTAFGGPQVPVDYLFISHLHADHVNGLKHFLSGRPVDTIVLPFLSDTARLLALVQSHENATPDDDIPADGWYARFIVNPIETLAEFRPRRFIVVRGDEGDGTLPDDEAPRAPDPDPNDPNPKKGFVERYIGPPPRILRAASPGIAELSEIGRGTGICVKGNTAVKWWLFAPYVVLGNEEELAFREALDARLGASGDGRTIENMRSILTDRRLFKEVRCAYYDVVRDLNLTSLSLLSAPLSAPSDNTVFIQTPRRNTSISEHDRSGWLGTGDSDLRTLKRRDLFLRYYAKYQSRTMIMSAPHHGSHESFHSELIDRIEPILVVASADHRAYGHPSPQVVSEVCAAGSVLWVSSSDPASRLMVIEFLRYDA